MGVVLFLVSLILSVIAVPIGLVFGFFKQIWKNSFKKALNDIDTKSRSMAISIDKFGNVVCAELFNATLIKNSEILFGDHRYTISNILGKNYRDGRLTYTGTLLINLLDMIDNNHALKSIEE